MQAPFDNIVQHLFHQPSLHSVTVDELENMAMQHPYFAAAHFLLLKKMQDTAHPEFTSQLHKTTIYFNNPLWLKFLLQPETVANFAVLEKPPFISSHSIETSHENVEEHSNDHTTETIAQKENLTGTEETINEDAAINIPGPAINESVPADAPAEHGSIMDVITEIFSDPNPLYNMEHTEPENNVIAEEKHEPVTQPDNSIQQEIALPEQLIQEEAGTINTSSDPWIDITNAAMHEEVAAPQQDTEEINATVTEEKTEQHDEALQEYSDNDTKHGDAIAEEQPAVEEINSANAEDVKTSPAEISTEHYDHENYEVHITPELPLHEEINTIQTEHISWPADESMTTAVSEFHTDEHQPEEALHAHAENDFTETPAAEIKNEESIVSEMTPEQTGDHYIDGALEADATDAVHETAEQTSNIEAVAKIEEPNFIKTIIETPAAKTDLLFEPFHTVDYFASQGIKLSKIETDSKDKFGKQLKSFTEWLKSMKKLPPSSINKMLAENEESRVVEDANHSIENKEVITVAMAEVFEKQGMHEKAAEIYQKLSLLNPAKSAYFAARIEALKH